MYKKNLLILLSLAFVQIAFTQSISLTQLGTYQTGVFDEGAAEIVAFDPTTQRAFFTNADANSITVLDLSDPSNPTLYADISQAPYGGGVNSVAVYNGIVAVAVEANEKTDNGVVVFWDTDGNFINSVEAGALPDMLTFTQDGTKVIVANEGEPNDDYTIDPEGSVTVIDVSNGAQNATAVQVNFSSFNGNTDLIDKGLRIFGPNATIAQDLEPEYIAEFPGRDQAAIVCQENNALAILDLTLNQIIDIIPLGSKDHNLMQNGIDPSNRDDSIFIRPVPVHGFYLPDAIKFANLSGIPCYLTANEGDSRDYDGYSEEARVKDLTLDPTAFPNAADLQEDDQIGRLKTTLANGDTDGDGDVDRIYSYGTRSFSIWNAVTGQLLYDSGNDFEKWTSTLIPNGFNASNDDNDVDDRSDDKGPEPEAIEIAHIDGKTYAFIGMERVGGIFMYDITNPSYATYVNYFNNRNFDQDVETPEAGDLGVEDIRFIDAENSPNGKHMLITANEVSGTVSIFEINTTPTIQLFDEEINIEDFEPETVVLPPSPLSTQVLFIGGHDIVQTTPTYGNPSGRAIAKEWHDFIGFTPDETNTSLGWVTVNHEQIYRDDRIGDGGGMTSFRVAKDGDDNLIVVDQTLDDGRSGKFFNVDFVNTVGETGMNCGGINGPNGRIWTAEEWYRSSTSSIWNSSAGTSNSPVRVASKSDGFGIRDTAAFTINTPEFPLINGMTIDKYQNFNYMTEIDPIQAVAVRKQYNWGRAGWEGGAISEDGKYVYLGIDGSPAPWVRFTAETPFDYTVGKMEVYKQDNPQGQKWIEVPMDEANIFGGLTEYAWSVGATMFMRNEWVTLDKNTGIVYWTETGRDGSSGAGARFVSVQSSYPNTKPATHHDIRALERGQSSATDSDYQDYYGTVLYYDPATEEVGIAISGGPYFEDSEGPSIEEYPNKHLSNPDGISIMTIDGHNFLMIQEDLNGTSHGRTPANVSNRLCELYLLDVDRAKNATVSDLIRITAVPKGAEITGAVQIDENTILVNSQHPTTQNPFPFNHSVTLAIHGFKDITVDGLNAQTNTNNLTTTKGFDFNQITREVTFGTTSDYALYNETGKRINVFRSTTTFSVDGLAQGEYTIIDANQNAYRFIIK